MTETLAAPKIHWSVSPDAERAILGCVMLAPGLLPDVLREFRRCPIPATGKSVWERVFSLDNSCIVWAAIVRLSESGTDLDPITIATSIAERGELPAAGGPAWIVECESFVHTTQSLASYIRLTINAAVKRASQAVAVDYLDALPDGEPNADLGALIDRLEGLRVSEQTSAERIGTLAEQGGDFSDDLDERLRGERGLESPWRLYNEKVGGFPPRRFVALAGKYHSGKTSLGLCAAVSCAQMLKFRNDPGCVVFLSAEMSVRELRFLIVSMRYGIDSNVWERKPLSTEHYAAAEDCYRNYMSHIPLRLVNAQDSSAQDIEDTLREIATQQPVRLAFIDYLQNLKAPRAPKGQSVTTEWAHNQNATALASLAHGGTLAGSPCIVALVQEVYEPKEMAKRKKNAFPVANPRDCRAIYGAVDFYSLLRNAAQEQPDQYENAETCPAELFVLKARGGKLGPCDLMFWRPYSLILDAGQEPEFVR